ncbi:hypothetical protein GCM10009634_42770 [Saccharothrix xinjiangensis]
MLSKIVRFAAVVAAASTVLLAPVSSASASGAGAYGTDARAALGRLSTTGALTEQDRKVLLKYPELAAGVMDPGKSVSGSTVVADPARAKEIGAQACWISDAYHHAFTLLGNTFYKFHHRADWCQDGSRVLGVHYRDHRFSEVASSAYPRHIESDVVTPTPSWEVRSLKKHLVENCVWDGCFSSTHPWVEHTMRGNGTGYPATGEN